ncbi:cell adhesion molecule 1-like [Prorops nasuta]|uniref:cell adhesion molecule 1-like n=1 Tax=Prorops nasuta TaxID=863751 RepID=UPI0034CECAF7
MDLLLSEPLFLLLLLLLRHDVGALRLLNVSVPSYTYRGESAKLECRYDLETDRLYSVSWYKDNEAFYRFVPRDSKSQHIYEVDGVRVNGRQSNINRVILQNVELRTRGKYKCEVSAEAPNFKYVSSEDVDMEVIALPHEGPTIVGEEKVYASGDVLALNCTSGKSHPASRLKWFINGVEVKPETEMTFEHHGLYWTISGLRLELGPHHLTSDKINVRCEASVLVSQETNAQSVDVRSTDVYVQGHGSIATPCVYLIVAAILQRLLIEV